MDSTRRVVVLLKNSTLEAVECDRDEVFIIARLRAAGICGVFEDRLSADAYIDKHRLPGTNVNRAG